MLFATEEATSGPGEDSHIEKPWSIGKSVMLLSGINGSAKNDVTSLAHRIPETPFD
jgi:hypothetical protein